MANLFIKIPGTPAGIEGRVIAMKDQFDVCLSCDTDHDRHGIVTPGAGLLSANHYLSAAIDYLFRSAEHLRAILLDAHKIVAAALQSSECQLMEKLHD